MKQLLLFLIALAFAVQSLAQGALNESFEGSLFPPDDWVSINTTGPLTPWTREANFYHSGSACAYVDYNSTGTENYLITPKLVVNSITDSISFWSRMSNFNATFNQTFLKVLVSTTDNSVSSFSTTALVDLSPSYPIGSTQITGDWKKWTISLQAYVGQEIYIAFKHNDNNGYGLCLDDILGPDLYVPTCPKPVSLTVSNPTLSGADLGWTDNIGSSWNIQYIQSSENDWTNAITISGVTNPYTFTNLNPSTVYKVRVQSNCGVELSEWSVPIDLATSCGSISLFPWYEGFESPNWFSPIAPGNKPAPNCWTVVDKGTDDDIDFYWQHSSAGFEGDGSHTGLGHAICYTDYGSSSHNDWLITPEIALTGNERLLFWAMRAWDGADEPDEISIYISNADITLDTVGMGQYGNMPNFTQIFNQMLPSVGGWQEYEVNLTQYTGNRYIAFVRQNTPDGYYLRLDDVMIDEIPTCARPTNIEMSNLTSDQVELTWLNGNQNDDSWYVYFKPSTSTIWDSIQVISNPYILTNLISATTYSVYIKTDCSPLLSEESNIISFQTKCVPLTVPSQVEEFLTSVPPSVCWSKFKGLLTSAGNSTLVSTPSGWTWNSNVTPHNAKINMYGSSINYWLISPSIDLGQNSNVAQLEFDLFYTAYNSANAASTNSIDDRFAVVVSTDNGLTWNVNNAVIWSNAPTATRVLNNITNTPTHIILPLFNPITFIPYTGTIKIGFYGESTIYNGDNDLHIDNFEVRPYTTCQRPTGTSVTNITTSTATFAFTENVTSLSWEYVYGESATITDPANGTPIATTNSSLQLTGLSPQTQYNIWVRSLCVNGNSDWSDLYSFVTESLPATVPYNYGFENAGENLGWKSISGGVNKWAKGSAAGNGLSTSGTKANYISNNNGLSYEMTDGNIYAYTYRDIDFGSTPASYGLTFDWKCQGDVSGNDIYSGLIVFLRNTSDSLSLTSFPSNVNDNLGVFSESSIWQTEEVSIDNVSGVKRLIFFYFDFNSNNDPAAAIDNISIEPQVCPRPFNLVAANLTSSSAELSWSHPGADSYIVYYRRNVSNSSLYSQSALNPYTTLQNLTLGTQYLVGVVAVCGGDTTEYSETVLFITPCSDGSIITFPWIESFESGLNCWGKEYVVGTNDWTNTSQYNSARTGSGFANFFYANNLTGYKTKLVSPELDLTGLIQPYVSFWHMQPKWVNDQDELKVFYRTSTSSSWVQLLHYTTDIASYRLDSIALPNPSTSYQIAFEGKQGFGRGVALDDIKVYDVVFNPCTPPTNIAIIPSNLSASVTWSAVGSESSWELKVGTAGAPIIATNTSINLTGLAPNASYTLYIRANCGTTYSSWRQKQFTTTSIATPPIVTTAVPAAQILHSSAVFNGTYVQTSEAIQTMGFEYKSTLTSTWTELEVIGGTSSFTYTATGLSVATQYTVRAYVTTATHGKVYGNIEIFTTKHILPPVVTTDSIVRISPTSATFYGTIIKKSEEIDVRGFEYKRSTQAWDNASNIAASGLEEISANLTTLTEGATYNVRAYARTVSGIKVYGQILTSAPWSLNEEIKNEVSIVMYPNPATNQTKLIVTGINGEVEIALSDVQGRVIKTIDAKPVNGVLEQTIDLNNLAKGVYYIRIQNSDISRTQKLIVK